VNQTDDSGGIGRTYLLVVICEVVVVAGLWALGRYYG
jgi:hypothetical protein